MPRVRTARKSPRSRALKRYWREVRGIERDQGVSLKKARKLWKKQKSGWKINVRTEKDYVGERDTTSFNAVIFLDAENRDDAFDKAYERIAEFFGRGTHNFIPRDELKFGAFRGYEKKRSWLKWKHKGYKKSRRALL
jgi:hypothetical protein